MATATFDLWQAYQAAPVIWGAIQDTTVLAYKYQSAPFLTKNEPASVSGAVYDSLGRLIAVTFVPQGSSVNYDYDAVGNRKSVTTKLGLGGL